MLVLYPHIQNSAYDWAIGIDIRELCIVSYRSYNYMVHYACVWLNEHVRGHLSFSLWV